MSTMLPPSVSMHTEQAEKFSWPRTLSNALPTEPQSVVGSSGWYFKTTVGWAVEVG
jgi:hypothetical protein